MPSRPRSSILFVLALVTAADFLLGGALTWPVLRFVPGVASDDRHLGTVLLAGLVVLVHLVRWWKGRRVQISPASVTLAAILVFALWSRLATLGWDAIHGPDGYEDHFVRAVLHMLREGDLNHRYHEYPGLFLYMLLGAYLVAFVTAVGARMGTTLANIPQAHFLEMGRGLVAGFGVLNVVLTYPLGKRWFNERVGLFAAALVALSYLELYTSHYIRPDIVLETFFVASLLAAFVHLERGTLATAVLAGASVGAATAVKYTGFLGTPALLLAVLLAPKAGTTPRWARFVLALAALLLAYAVLSPYTFLDLPCFLYGVAEQGLYNTDPSLQPADNMARYYTLVLARESIGYPALVLLLVGAGRIVAAPRARDLVALAFIVPYLSFFFASPAQFDRFLLPAQPALAVVAGHGLDWILGLVRIRIRIRASRPVLAKVVGAVLVAGVLVPPSLQTMRYLKMRLQPSVRDEVRDWALGNLPPGTRIGVSRLGPSFRGTPFAESRFVRLDESTYPLLLQFDFLVSAAIDDPEVLSRFREITRFEPSGPGGGQTQVVYQVPDRLKPSYRPVAVGPTAVETSDNPGEAGNLVDSNPDTGWRGAQVDRPQRIDVDLGESRRVSLVTLEVPDEDDAVDAATRLRAQASSDGRNYWNARRFVLSESEPASPDRMRVSIFLDARAARYLRFVEPREEFGGLSIQEMEFFESEEP